MDKSVKNLYELNIPETLADISGELSLTMSADAYLERFIKTRDELPTEITVLDPIDFSAYPDSAGLTVYVAPTGDDRAEGTKDAPLRTPAAALLRVRGKGGATVILCEGSYSVDEPLTLTSEHSGTDRAPLIIRSAEGERVSITSNKAFSTAPSGAWPTP